VFDCCDPRSNDNGITDSGGRVDGEILEKPSSNSGGCTLGPQPKPIRGGRGTPKK
jgi:hypothetical protein